MTQTKPRKNHRREPEVEVGGIDPMSVSAAFHKLPLCGRYSPDFLPASTSSHPRCTRASGHCEDGSTKHVAAGTGSVESIWES